MKTLIKLTVLALFLMPSLLLANNFIHQTFPELRLNSNYSTEYYADNSCKASKKPKPIGCKFTCKPCLIPVCNNGAWELELQDLPDSCNPTRIPVPTDNLTCKIKIYEFCPPSCRSCTRE